jgi:hypothetical protein
MALNGNLSPHQFPADTYDQYGTEEIEESGYREAGKSSHRNTSRGWQTFTHKD